MDSSVVIISCFRSMRVRTNCKIVLKKFRRRWFWKKRIECICLQDQNAYPRERMQGLDEQVLQWVSVTSLWLYEKQNCIVFFSNTLAVYCTCDHPAATYIYVKVEASTIFSWKAACIVGWKRNIFINMTRWYCIVHCSSGIVCSQNCCKFYSKLGDATHDEAFYLRFHGNTLSRSYSFRHFHHECSWLIIFLVISIGYSIPIFNYHY